MALPFNDITHIRKFIMKEMCLYIGISLTNMKTYMLQLLIHTDNYIYVIYIYVKLRTWTHMNKKSDVFCIHYKNQFISLILSGTFQIFMARLPDQCPFCLPAEVCFANSLIAALLCRVEYNPFPPRHSLPPSIPFSPCLSFSPCSLVLFGCSARPAGMPRLFDQVFIIGDSVTLGCPRLRGASWGRSVASMYKRPLNTRLNSRQASRLR